ncbi:MAG: hypothetical protein BWY99_02178 [Synergistetes bacterium ADurb.BinA166]|nr:MAG: hypothetical protein BWY99_02178 [Synergistetes bacterium ADurb.BinA166]
MDQEKPFVFAKCKRGSDAITAGQACDSTSAYCLSEPGSRVVSFQCKKCRHLWTVPLGGAANF